jgi:hypothetical protein
MNITSTTRIICIMLCCVTSIAAIAQAVHNAASGNTASTSPDAAWVEARKQAAHRSRRIIMNNDGNDCNKLASDAPITRETFLARRTTALLGSNVDTIFYCTGVFNLYTHRSELTQQLGEGETKDWAWALKLYEAEGVDPLEAMIEFCNTNRIEIFWSMRMNDTHDSGPDHQHLMCQWKRDHPEYMFGTVDERPAYGGRRWSALNYALPDVRQRVLDIFTDVCRRYPVDGIEMDFFRHPVFFLPQGAGQPVTQEHCDMMTDLLRHLRRMTEAVGRDRGRPLLISVRVPDSLGFAKAIGLDVQRWLEDDLVDIVAGSGYIQLEPWENLVALGKRYNVPVYAVLSGSRLVDSAYPESAGKIEAWRGEALRAWRAGISGIYTFNRFVPTDPIFRELGDPKMLEQLPWTYERNVGPSSHVSRWLKGGERYVVPDSSQPPPDPAPAR